MFLTCTKLKFASRALHLELQQIWSEKFMLQRLWRSHRVPCHDVISSYLLGGRGPFEDGSVAQQALANEVMWWRQDAWGAISARLDGTNGRRKLTAVQRISLLFCREPGHITGSGNWPETLPDTTLPTIITDPITRWPGSSSGTSYRAGRCSWWLQGWNLNFEVHLTWLIARVTHDG